jgi:hypothetical protein
VGSDLEQTHKKPQTTKFERFFFFSSASSDHYGMHMWLPIVSSVLLVIFGGLMSALSVGFSTLDHLKLHGARHVTPWHVGTVGRLIRCFQVVQPVRVQYCPSRAHNKSAPVFVE